MRDILFRGKDCSKGKWIFGQVIKTDSGICYIYEMTRNANLYFQEVDPDSVGQWTGFVDRAGKKLFEGDKVKSYFTWGEKIGKPTGGKSVVVFDEDSAQFAFQLNDGEKIPFSHFTNSDDKLKETNTIKGKVFLSVEIE